MRQEIAESGNSPGSPRLIWSWCTVLYHALQGDTFASSKQALLPKRSLNMRTTEDGSVSSSTSLSKPPSIASRRPSSTANTVVGSIDHTLLQGNDPRLRADAAAAGVAGIPTYPRRRWSLADVHLPRRSSLWPKPVVAVQIHDDDVPAATVAIRITECLRRRSIAVEPNEEDATAVCSTVDGCVWTIHIWHGLLVECMPVRGNTLSFHTAARAVLRAAEGLESGADTRRPWQVSPLEFPRLLRMQEQCDDGQEQKQESLVGLKTKEEADSLAREGLERIRELLLHKDRFECQQLALESLICYTDTYSVSPDVARRVAHLLSSTTKEWSPLHKHLLTYVTANTDDTANNDTIMSSTPLLRTMALHVFANLRTHHAQQQQQQQPSLPNHADLLAGATRPATMTTRPGPHDAAFTLAATATIAAAAQQHATCQTVGRATHAVLAGQARRVYEQTTLSEREC